MNAAVIWLFSPFVVSLVLLPLSKYRRFIMWTSAVTAVILAVFAILIQIDQAIELGGFSLKIASEMTILGRQFIIRAGDQPILVLLYGIAAFWGVGAIFLRTEAIFGPAALMITSLLCSALCVEPFLYASLLIEGAVLVSVMMLTYHRSRINQGVLRYLTFQTIGFPLMLLTGWLLSGLETGTANPSQVARALTFMGLGFAFILAIFPLYSWIPMLAEEEDPYLAGFIFVMITTTGTLFLLTFLDRFSWLVDESRLNQIILYAGILMVFTGGIWAGFQKNVARMFGYSIIVINGFLLISIGLFTARSLSGYASMLLGNSIAVGLWSLGLSLLKTRNNSLQLHDLDGIARQNPLPVAGILVAQFSIAGLPILAGFPLVMTMLEELARSTQGFTWIILPGIFGIWAAGIYSLFIFTKIKIGEHEMQRNPIVYRVLITIGITALIWIGMLPQTVVNLMRLIISHYPRLITLQ